VQDCYQQYLVTSPVTDPTGPGIGPNRVIRGGYWEGYAQGCRPALRNGGDPWLRGRDFGFRLARTAG
jgi:formylglycine-generating enzyme required for sulfatase activity